MHNALVTGTDEVHEDRNDRAAILARDLAHFVILLGAAVFVELGLRN